MVKVIVGDNYQERKLRRLIQMPCGHSPYLWSPGLTDEITRLLHISFIHCNFHLTDFLLLCLQPLQNFYIQYQEFILFSHKQGHITSLIKVNSQKFQSFKSLIYSIHHGGRFMAKTTQIESLSYITRNIYPVSFHFFSNIVWP